MDLSNAELIGQACHQASDDGVDLVDLKQSKQEHYALDCYIIFVTSIICFFFSIITSCYMKVGETFILLSVIQTFFMNDITYAVVKYVYNAHFRVPNHAM